LGALAPTARWVSSWRASLASRCALKDSIANLLAGVLILLYRPFDIGDRVDVGGLSGHVVKIDLRYTELDNPSERVLVPNSKLLTDPVRVSKTATA
jgi:small conductance mechanosensitive channel